MIKKIVKYIVMFVLGGLTSLLVFLSSVGPGIADWEYDLPNDFKVCHINSKDIIINYSGNGTVENIDNLNFIKEFSYDDRYVFVRSVESISENNILNEEYFVLDTVEKKVYDSCNSTEELQRLADELKVKIPQKWYRTSPDPTLN